MSEAPILPKPRPLRALLLGGSLLVAALGGAAAMRWWTGEGTAGQGRQQQAPRSTRPIVQIVRQQEGLPDLADAVEQICPSVALLVPAGTELPPASGTAAVPAVRISDDGWLLTAGRGVKSGMDAVFGTGQRVAITEVRTDPVSGLTIARTEVPAGGAGGALPLSDGPPQRVGQFALAVATPAGAGCTSDVAMVQSDFLADGGADSSYVRLQQTSTPWPAGLPIFAADGRILGLIAPDAPPSTAIPASIARPIVDELLRQSLSPSVAFGFRAVDFTGRLATRIGDVRAGAGVAIVEPGSGAGQAGLQAGDVITRVGDQPVSSASELGRALDTAGDEVVLTVLRRGEAMTLPVSRG